MTRIHKSKHTPPKPKQVRLTNRVPLRSLNTNIPRRIVDHMTQRVVTAVQPASQDGHIIQQHHILTNVSNSAESFNFTYQQEVQQRRNDQENFERQLAAAHQVGCW